MLRCSHCRLGIHLGAYIAETIRAGLTSVRKTQMSALAQGMSRTQQANNHIAASRYPHLPALGSRCICGQDSAIASVIAVPELLRQTQVVAGAPIAPRLYTAAMLVYFLLCFPVARSVDMIYKRARISGPHDIPVACHLGEPSPPA
jgi:polar amino acid transport system permease protein